MPVIAYTCTVRTRESAREVPLAGGPGGGAWVARGRVVVLAGGPVAATDQLLLPVRLECGRVRLDGFSAGSDRDGYAGAGGPPPRTEPDGYRSRRHAAAREEPIPLGASAFPYATKSFSARARQGTS
jgi:hypothetical protein